MNNEKLLPVLELDEITENTNFIINMPINNINWFEDITGKKGEIYKGCINNNLITNLGITGFEFYHTYDNNSIIENEYYNFNLSINNLNHDERNVSIYVILLNEDNYETLLKKELIVISNSNLKYKILGKNLKSYNRIRVHMHAEDPYWIPKQSFGLDIFNIYI